MSNTVFAIAGLSPQELLLVVAVIFLLFGATRLPQLAKSLGQSKRAFKEGLEEAEKESPKKVEEKKSAT
jgi:sec-independent protein translocase protein TatA